MAQIMPETNPMPFNDLTRGGRIVLLRFRLVPWVAGIITLLATLGHRLNNIPLNRLFELNICREYYWRHDPSMIEPGGDVAEERCKENDIQVQLAFIVGLISTLELICGMRPWSTFRCEFIDKRWQIRTLLQYSLGLYLGQNWT